MPKKLVRLRTRPSRDGQTFVFMLDYVDEDGKRRRIRWDMATAARQRNSVCRRNVSFAWASWHRSR